MQRLENLHTAFDLDTFSTRFQDICVITEWPLRAGHGRYAETAEKIDLLSCVSLKPNGRNHATAGEQLLRNAHFPAARGLRSEFLCRVRKRRKQLVQRWRPESIAVIGAQDGAAAEHFPCDGAFQRIMAAKFCVIIVSKAGRQRQLLQHCCLILAVIAVDPGVPRHRRRVRIKWTGGRGM